MSAITDTRAGAVAAVRRRIGEARWASLMRKVEWSYAYFDEDPAARD
jgi:hypothetical protein